MNTKVFNILKWVALAFLLIFVFSQIYAGLINPLTTDTVYSYSTYKGYDTTGFIVRNETVVEDTVSGVLSYDVMNGGRVAKGGTIATVYSSSQEADNRIRVQELEKRIATLEKIQNYNALNASDLTSVNRTIKDALTDIIRNTQGGKVTTTEKYDVLLENMARRQIITGQVTDFNSLLTQLKAEKDRLTSTNAGVVDKVVSPQSGYVIYSVDGYENALTVESLDTLTAQQLSNVQKDDVPQNAVCKIVSDYEWYIAVNIPFDESLNLKEGGKVTLKTQLLSVPELTATVKLINKQSVGDKAVVVFACNTMNNELAGARSIDITVVYEQFDGLKVDNRAIRTVEGQKGVYVLLAQQVRFVPVEVIWSGENYSIVKQEASEKEVLRIYDEIIVKGKNLYDGKIIN